MTEFFTRLLELTAWTMTPPQPFSSFHLYFFLIGGFLAVFLAWRLRHLKEDSHLRLLSLLGLILALSEIYKQLFLTLIVGHGTYDWWYFPFQLCSLLMYFCLFFPSSHHLPGRFYTLFCILIIFPAPYWSLSGRKD